MKTKLFVSNLDFEVENEQLEQLFKEVANPISVVIARDRDSKRSKGFAFVEMTSDDEAKKAIDELNNKSLNGRPIKVSYDRGKGDSARPRGQKRPDPLPTIQRMQLFRRRRKLDPFLEDPTRVIDYRDVVLLSRFVSERGKIMSRRYTGLSAYSQRKVAKAIKRAQNTGLMSFQND